MKCGLCSEKVRNSTFLLLGRSRGRRRLLAGEVDEDVVEAGLLEAEFNEANAPLVGEHVAEDHAHPLVGHVARDGAAVSLQVAHRGEPVAEELHSAGDDRLA